MALTININDLTLTHRASDGVSTATLPDVCKTPPLPQPVPYPNIAYSTDLVKGTTTVNADGGNMCAVKDSEFAKSTGDEPGAAGGVKSGVNMMEASWITYSFDVKFEGRNAARLTDKMLHNHGNTVNAAGELQKNLSAKEFCQLCKDCRKAAEDEINRNQPAEQKTYSQLRSKLSLWDAPRKVVELHDQEFNKLNVPARDPALPPGPTGATTDPYFLFNITNIPAQSGPCAKLWDGMLRKHEGHHAETGFKWWGWQQCKDETEAYEISMNYLKEFIADCDSVGC